MLIWLALLAVGCAPQAKQIAGAPDVVFIVPGVGGPSGYDALIQSLGRPNRAIHTIVWGAPPPLFFLNYSDQSIHNTAEAEFSARIEQWHRDHPTGRIDIIGHSAGCGVALGAIARLPQARVEHLILLAPSVSPGYNLQPALAKVNAPIHVYTSTDDTMLQWRTSSFSTYDRVQTAAAGVGGFTSPFPPGRVIHHPFEPRWTTLGHDGGHWGPLADRFSQLVIAPLLTQDVATAQSLSARHMPAASPGAGSGSSVRD